MNTKFEELTKAIQKANSSILELKFGCKVIFHKKIDSKYIQGIYIMSPKYGNPVIIAKEYRGEIPLKWIKIIGRDITLFDIKQCLVYYGYTTKEFCEIAELWKEPNSLDEQSNELKDKLYEYIKNKNS